jgi:hypothetical protein
MSSNDATNQPHTIIVKIAGNDQIRRWTAKSDQMTFAALVERVSEMFKTPKFIITYKDDEGDDITLGCDEELADAIALSLKSEPSVLRLKLTDLRRSKSAKPTTESEPLHLTCTAPPGGQPFRGVAPPSGNPTVAPPPSRDQPASTPSPPRGEQGRAPEPATAAFNAPASFLENLAKKLPELVSRLPPHLQSIVKECELDIAATAAANKAARAASTGYNSSAGAASDGFNATTQAAATGLDAATRAVQIAASVASHASDAATAAAAVAAHAAVESDPRLEGFHPGVRCDKTDQCPIIGTRYNLIGHNFDLCEAEYAKLPTDLKLLYKAIPPRVFRRKVGGGLSKGVRPDVRCDRTGNIIVGMRYHLPGHDFDLCEGEYEKPLRGVGRRSRPPARLPAL